MLQARDEYSVFAWQNRRDAFAWQAWSTKVLFWVVIIVVLAGLYLSWMQFYFAHNAPLKVDKPSNDKPSNGVNTVEVNTSGVKITSNVIGLIILTLSIVFFFLYLKFVYHHRCSGLRT
jgi:hypothetical protein